MNKSIYLFLAILTIASLIACSDSVEGPQSTEKTINEFGFKDVSTVEITSISGSEIELTVPYGTDVTSLVGTFSISGVSVSVDGITQVSGTTTNDFTSPVTYTVTAEDGSSQVYTVTVFITVDRTQLDAMIAGGLSISYADTSKITDMNSLFMNNTTFNQDISNWDVSSVISMRAMFDHADSFNQDLSGWDVSHVEDMASMFNYTIEFDQDISGWDVSNVTNMSLMFSSTQFNNDISKWNVGNVTQMSAMFYNNTHFNQDISGWNVENVTVHVDNVLWSCQL